MTHSCKDKTDPKFANEAKQRSHSRIGNGHHCKTMIQIYRKRARGHEGVRVAKPRQRGFHGVQLATRPAVLIEKWNPASWCQIDIVLKLRLARPAKNCM